MKENIFETRVRYADTDSYGVVYFGSYLVWVEAARTEFFRKFTNKGPIDYEKEGIAFPFVNVNIKYLNPARTDEKIKVKTQLIEVGNTSITMKFLIENEKGQVCEVDAVMVCVTERIKKRSVPNEIKELI